MVEVWFGIVALMLTAYLVLDGFDFGAGAVYLFVARSDAERRQVLAAIGPFWDGNEVWLLASSGVLLMAFPQAMASGLSGFYFAIFLIVWSLILRGIGIEFRSHLPGALWRSAWDAVFSAASVLLAVLFGAALGNLIRGVPLDQDGWFSMSLFTDFGTSNPVGVLDWYTVLAGVFAAVGLATHGAVFLAWKTDGDVGLRCHRLAVHMSGAVAVLWPALTVATIAVNPLLWSRLQHRPLAWLCVVVMGFGVFGVWWGLRNRRHLWAFIGSCGCIAGVLAATAVCLFPDLITSITAGTPSLTAYNTSAPTSGLRLALRWWLVGFPLAVAYLVTLFRIHRGKAAGARGHGGY